MGWKYDDDELAFSARHISIAKVKAVVVEESSAIVARRPSSDVKKCTALNIADAGACFNWFAARIIVTAAVEEMPQARIWYHTLSSDWPCVSITQ